MVGDMNWIEIKCMEMNQEDLEFFYKQLEKNQNSYNQLTEFEFKSKRKKVQIIIMIMFVTMFLIIGLVIYVGVTTNG
jgi:hypothetical protein